MADTLEILKHFDELPDDALVSSTVVAVVAAVNERTIRRIYRDRYGVPVSPQIYRYPVRFVRKLVRGELATAT